MKESALKKISKYYLWSLPLVLALAFLLARTCALKGAYLKYFYFTVFIIYISISLLLKTLFLKSNLSSFDLALKRKSILGFIIASVSIYTLVFSALSILKFEAYNMGMIDFGRMVQAVWNTSSGRLLMNTWDTGNVSRLSGHVEFIFLPIALIYRIFSDPKILLILQTMAFAFGAIAVYLVARQILASRLCGFLFLLAFLFYPSNQYPNLIDFHPDTLALACLIFAFYFCLKKHWLFYYLFLILALSCREYVSLLAVTLGIYLVIFERKAKSGIITIFLGSLWFVLAYKMIPPYFNQGKEIATLYHYESLGSSVGGVMKSILFHPLKVFGQAVTPLKVAYLILLLLPLGFFSLFSLPILLVGAPVLAGVFLTDYFCYTNHHNSVIIPFLFISAIKGAKWISGRLKAYPNAKYALTIYLFSCSIFSALLYSPGPLAVNFWNNSSYHYWLNLHQFKVTEHDRIANRFIKMIPPGARVSASNHLASHLSHRETIYRFPYPKDMGEVDYILVDLIEYFPTVWNPRQGEVAVLKKLLSSGAFVLKEWEDGILLLEKGPQKKSSYDLHISLGKKVSAGFSVNYAFDQRLLLKGFDLEFDRLIPGEKNKITYYWQVLEDFDKEYTCSYFGSTEKLSKDLIVIDNFKNASGQLRIVHLPLYILFPAQEWKAGDLIKEELEFYFPLGFSKGNYSWKIGCYIVPEYYFIRTDQENLIPGTKELKLSK